ncbi:SLAM family member 9-like [Lithobates pipiens]
MNMLSFVLLVAFRQVSAEDHATEEVFGLLNHSVQLSSHQTLTVPIEEFVWTFTSEGKTVKVAAIKNGKLAKYADQFADRIKTFRNGAILVIEQLTLRDSGKYMADITLTTKQSHEQSFILSVYEPVPAPSLEPELEKKTDNWCNMTVHCSVPTNLSVVSYIWKYRHGGSAYQQYNSTGDTVQMSLQPESWDMDLLCIVHNLVDQKNVTLYLQPICVLGCAFYLRLALTATYLVLSVCFICLSHRYK